MTRPQANFRLSPDEVAALHALAGAVGCTHGYHRTRAAAGNASELLRQLVKAWQADPTTTVAGLTALLTPGRAPTPPAPSGPTGDTL